MRRGECGGLLFALPPSSTTLDAAHLHPSCLHPHLCAPHLGDAALVTDPLGGSSHEDMRLVMKLLAVMEATGADFTNTFRVLMGVAVEPSPAAAAVLPTSSATPATSFSASSASAASSAASSDEPAAATATASALPATAVATTEGSSSSDSGSDPILPRILAQCSTAKEIAAAARPSTPPEQLAALQALAARDPNAGEERGREGRWLYSM